MERTLRDEIAIAAMQGMLSNIRINNDINKAAASAYKMADAMLKEREKAGK